MAATRSVLGPQPATGQSARPASDDLEGLMPIEEFFQPFRLKSLDLKNRFVMAPMTRSFSPSGVPTPEVAAYYTRRAQEVGLIISEGTVIERPASSNDPDVPHFYGSDALAGWKQVIDQV